MPAPIGNKNAVKKGEKATTTMFCKIKPSDKEKFKAKANEEGLSFCAWVMRMLNK